MEEWKPIPGYMGMYSVSDLGQIRGEDRIVPHMRDGKRIKSRILKAKINKQTGYPAVVLCSPSGQKTFPIHVLVALAFIGPRPIGMEIAHFDGDRRNAKLSNLRYATPKENRDDSRRHGTLARGERLPYSKLTEASVIKIRKDDRLQKIIAAEFGVSVTTISQVKSRKQWAHVG
jgi:hypothetical protein